MMKYPDEFKREALKLAAQPGIKVAQVERDLGITPGLIYKWRQRLRVDEKSDELRPSAERETEAEIRRLKHELSIAREERDILEKLSKCFRRKDDDEVSIYGESPRAVQCAADVPGAGRIK